MSLEQIKKDWEKRGFGFGIWEDSPGQVWKDYVHDVDELFMLAEGKVSVTIDGKMIEAVVGEETFILAHAKHTVSTSNKTESVWYYGYREHKE